MSSIDISGTGSPREIVNINRFIIRSIFRDPVNRIVLIHYDAPGVAGRFQITRPDYVPLPYSISIRNDVGLTSPIDGGAIPPGTYRIADLSVPSKIHDLGLFQAPAFDISMSIPQYPANKEIEFTKEVRLSNYGNSTYFFASRSTDGCVYLPPFSPAGPAGITITIMNWASTEGFGPQDAKPFNVYFNSRDFIALLPGQKRSFTSIYTAQRGILRWAPM
jgi:hypothetical protein